MSLTKKEKSLLPVFKDIDKHLTDDVLNYWAWAKAWRLC